MKWIFNSTNLAAFRIPALERLDCAIALTEVGDFTSSLVAEEVDMVATMSADRRRQTFSSGRHCVRLIQHELNQDVAPIGRRERAPIWPQGFGSITHSDTYAAAAMAYSGYSLGVDLEELGRVEEHLWRVIFTPSEQSRLNSELASIGFSAKEAGYKAIYPIGQKFINFQEAEIDIDRSSQTFQIRYLGEHEPNKALERGQGHFHIAHDHVLTYFEIATCKH